MLILTTINARSIKDTWYTRAIRIWCWSKYNHTAELEYNTLTKETWVYEAVEKFRRISLSEWLKEYEPIEYCNMNKTYNITQKECRDTVNILQSFVGTDYGKNSIVGLVVRAFTGLYTIGIDGIKRLICSEASVRAWYWLIRRFAIIKWPIDYISPKQRNKYFKMKLFTWVKYFNDIKEVERRGKNVKN